MRNRDVQMISHLCLHDISILRFYVALNWTIVDLFHEPS